MPKTSRRTAELGTENAFVVLAEVNELIRQGKNIISFCIGQPDFQTPAHIVEAAIKALRDGHHGYTPALGILLFRDDEAGQFLLPFLRPSNYIVRIEAEGGFSSLEQHDVIVSLNQRTQLAFTFFTAGAYF